MPSPPVTGSKQPTSSVQSPVFPNMLFAAALDRNNNTLATMGSAVFLKHDVIQEEQGIFAMLTKGALPVAVDIVRGGEVIGRLVLFEDVRQYSQQFIFDPVRHHGCSSCQPASLAPRSPFPCKAALRRPFFLS